MKHYQIPQILIVFLSLICIRTNCQENPWNNIGPFMRTINAMAIDYSHPDTVYAAYPQGIYKSVNGAENWVVTGLTDVEINAVIVSQINPNLLLANSDGSVFKSEDYGDTWTEIWESEEYTIGAIAFDPSDNLSIWVGINVGMHFSGTDNRPENLYHSKDGGDTWESVHFPKWVDGFGVEKEEMKLQNLSSIHFDQYNSSVIYVCGRADGAVYGGIFVSLDKGQTWTNYKPGGGSSNTVVAIASTSEDYEPHACFVLVGIPGSKRELFQSPDYGATWIEIDVPTYEEGHIERDYFDFFANVMDFDPLEPEWLYFGGNYQDEASLVAYDIEEDSWHYFPGTPLKNPTALAMHPDVWYMGFRNDGIFRFADEDDDWEPKNEGMNDIEIYDFDLFPDYPEKIVAVIDDYIVHSYNTGATWSRRTESVFQLRVNPQDTNTYFSGEVPSNYDFGDPFYCQRSGNRGGTWISHKLFSRGGQAEVSYQMQISDIHIFPTNPEIVMAGVDGGEGCGEGLYRSDDGGSSWSYLFNFGVSSIAMDPIDNNNVYFGTTNLGYVYKSDDWGESGGLISPEGADAFASDIYDLEVDKNHRVLAATSSGLYAWKEGEDWGPIGSFPSDSTISLTIDNTPAVPVYYVGTRNKGVFVSSDAGVSWQEFNNELGSLKITKLKLSSTEPKNIYAATPDGGMWITTVDEYRAELSTIQSQEPELTIFPNPNNGTFNISTDGNANYNGTLKIMNLTGAVVYSANNIELGSHISRTVSIEDITPGTYILEFRSAKVSINEMIIINQ